jgi:hypothetical protein
VKDVDSILELFNVEWRRSMIMMGHAKNNVKRCRI